VTLLERLRERTGPWHRRLEAELPLLAPASDAHVYARYLGKLWGFHAPVEHALALVPGLERTGLSTAQRVKCPALVADLAALGLTRAELARLPRCEFSPEPTDVPSALGCMYVLEGATLGGQVVCRELRRRMPAVIEAASSYLTIYGAETGARWREFTHVLAELPSDAREETAVLDAACTTFQALHRWLVELPSAARVARRGEARDGVAREGVLAPEGAPLDG